MNFKLVGGSLSALLLAAALAGCTGGGNAGGSGTGGTAANFSGSDTVATVGSSTVTRADLAQTLEGLYGESILPQMIDNQLVAEKLKAKNLTVSDDEINAELSRVEEQDPSVKSAIDAGGPRVEVIKNQVRRNLGLRKLLTADIPDNEAEEKKFFTTYASYYGSPVQIKIGILAASTKTRADQLERSLKAKPDSFDALVAEQKSKAQTDPIGAQSTTDTGRFQDLDAFGPLGKTLTTAKKGTVLPVQALSPQGPFLIVKVVDRKEAVKPTYDQVKSQVATDYKLAQVAEKEVKRNPTNPPKLEDNIKAVIQNFARPNPQTGAPGIKASLTDALTNIASPASSTLLEGLRTAGTVQVSDSTYKDVAKQYQPLPGAAGAANTATDNGATGNAAAGNDAAGGSADANTAAANTATANTATTNTAAANTAAGSTATNSAAPSTP